MTFCVIQVYLILEKTNNKHLSELVSFGADRIKNTIEVFLNERYLTLHRMAERLSKGQPQGAWLNDAQHYLNDYQDLDFIVLLDQNLKPLKFVKKDHFSSSDLKKIINHHAISENPKKTKSVSLKFEDEKIILLFMPYSRGFLVEAISEKGIIDKTIEPEVKERYGAAINTAKYDRKINDSNYVSHRIIKFFDQELNLDLSPKEVFFKINKNETNKIILIFGIIFNLFLAFFVVFLYLLRIKHGHDETERIAKEKRIEELANRLEIATDSAKMGVWDYDILNNTAFWDNNMYRLYGLEPGLIIQSALETWQSSLHPDDFDSATLNIKNAIEGRSKLDTTFRVYWPNGTLKYLRSTGKLLRDNNGIPIRMIGVNWDITQEKELEQLKNEFISIVSHEIRTPLTSIYISLKLIQDEKMFQIPADLKQLIRIASESCESLTRLINDVLDVEKIDSGRISLNIKVHSVQSLISHAMEANRAFAEMHCNVPLVLDGEIPSNSYLEVDADRFQQVMANLISNAAKFSYPQQPVKVAVSRMGKNIRFSVSNKGDPIPESFRARIFEKFCQADTSNTRKKGGTGLGLNICKSIIEQHHGSINFESSASPDGKTVFYFDLPEAPQQG